MIKVYFESTECLGDKIVLLIVDHLKFENLSLQSETRPCNARISFTSKRNQNLESKNKEKNRFKDREINHETKGAFNDNQITSESN